MNCKHPWKPFDYKVAKRNFKLPIHLKPLCSVAISRFGCTVISSHLRGAIPPWPTHGSRRLPLIKTNLFPNICTYIKKGRYHLLLRCHRSVTITLGRKILKISFASLITIGATELVWTIGICWTFTSWIRAKHKTRRWILTHFRVAITDPLLTCGRALTLLLQWGATSSKIIGTAGSSSSLEIP